MILRSIIVARLLLGELLPRPSKVKLLDEPKFIAANSLSGPKSLPLRIHPA